MELCGHVAINPRNIREQIKCERALDEVRKEMKCVEQKTKSFHSNCRAEMNELGLRVRLKR